MYVEVFNAAQAYIHLEPIYLLIIIIIISYILSKTEEMQSKPVLAKILFVISIMIPITAFIYSVRDYNNLQKEISHDFINNGADMIIGHHPHVVQGMEIYKEKPIFYSLGNFIFDQYFSKDTQEGLGIGISTVFTPEEQLEYKIYLYPFKAVNNQNILMNELETKDFLKEFLKWSNLSGEYQKQVLGQEVYLK